MKLMTSTWKCALAPAILSAACSGSPPSPASPAAVAPPNAPSPSPDSGLAISSLAVEDPFILVHGGGIGYQYGVRFLLRETTGRSGATIERIVIRGPAGSDETNSNCWRTGLRLPPAGVLDTFYTDAGAEWLLYCGPGTGGPTPTPALIAEVTFRDDEGRIGSVSTPVTRVR